MPVPDEAPVMLPVMLPTAQEKVLDADASRVISVGDPLQTAHEVMVVRTGFGFTVTVMVRGEPEQEPAADVGITMYSTVPAEVASGLVKTWLMADPLPALAPEMFPVMLPIVQANVLDTVAERVNPVLVPLHMDTTEELVISGTGLTVTVMVEGEPVQDPAAEVGVTMYWTEPDNEWLWFVRTWLITEPEPAEAPVISPLMVPMVQE